MDCLRALMCLTLLTVKWRVDWHFVSECLLGWIYPNGLFMSNRIVQSDLVWNTTKLRKGFSFYCREWQGWQGSVQSGYVITRLVQSWCPIWLSNTNAYSDLSNPIVRISIRIVHSDCPIGWSKSDCSAGLSLKNNNRTNKYKHITGNDQPLSDRITQRNRPIGIYIQSEVPIGWSNRMVQSDDPTKHNTQKTLLSPPPYNSMTYL